MMKNCCEHGDHGAPVGRRFCSTDCMICEGLEPLGSAGCAGACGGMGLFDEREIREAVQYAENGGQALHCHQILTPGAPGCFVRDVNAGKDIGHLFDLDLERLEKTARRLGVRVIVIDRADTSRQHLDLCGRPMERAIEKCRTSNRKRPYEKPDGETAR